MEVLRPVKSNMLLNPGSSTTTDSVKYVLIIPDLYQREQEFKEVMDKIIEELAKIVWRSNKYYAAVLFTGSGALIDNICINSLISENKKVCIIITGNMRQE